MPKPKRRLARWAGAGVGTAAALAVAIWLAVSSRRGGPARPAWTSSAAPAAPPPASAPGGASPSGTPAAATSASPREPAQTTRPRADTGAHPAVGTAVPGARADAPQAQPEARRIEAAAAPPVTQPAAQPAQQAAAPAAPAPAPQNAPEPAVPAPAADPRTDIEQLVAAYARAIESRSVAEIRRAYPGLTGSQQQGWEQFFQTVRSVRARLAITRLDVSGASADLAVSGSYEYDAGGGRAEHQPVSFRATAALEGGAWRLRTIR